MWSAGLATMSSCESIYNLVPETVVPPVKPPMYHSRFDPKSTPIAGSTFGCHGTTLLLGAGKVHRKDFATLGPSHKQAADPKVRGETLPEPIQWRYFRRGETTCTGAACLRFRMHPCLSAPRSWHNRNLFAHTIHNTALSCTCPHMSTVQRPHCRAAVVPEEGGEGAQGARAHQPGDHLQVHRRTETTSAQRW